MQKGKHNIYSKEELLKLIKEGKNAPADMDEFEREALEGLKLLDKPEVLNELNAEIDSIVAKDKRKKTIYYFSAAASLILLIGLVLFFKNEVAPNVTKNDRSIASVEKLKKPEETATPAQPETQTTYEAKEPEEALAKKELANKKDVFIIDGQTGPPRGSIENTLLESNEKEQEAAKQEAKDAYNETDTKLAFAKKATTDEESKAAAPQIMQEQQQDVTTTETASNNNNVLGDREKDNDKNDKPKKESVAVTGNTAPTQQPTLAAFSNSNAQGAKAAENFSYQTKDDQNVAVQKNKTAGLYQAKSSDKKSTTSSYREPAFIDGDAAFAAYVKQNLKISSPSNSGIIVVEFLITKSGKAEKIKIIKPLDGCDTCSKDVIDLIKSIKKWAPAVIDGNTSDAIKKLSIQYN